MQRLRVSSLSFNVQSEREWCNQRWFLLVPSLVADQTVPRYFYIIN
jgi:hypothetical protein